MELNSKKSYRILTMNTIIFTACFGVWMMYGVLAKFLSMPVIVDGQLFENGYLGLKDNLYYIMVTPVLTGTVLRLPVGVLTTGLGGPLFLLLMARAARGARS